MVIMDAYYSSDRLQEVWQAIDHLHLSYLEMEESPEKLDHRIRLENCIREFLCMASHSQKFFLRETGEVLYRSASMKKDFSGYKAATGWNALQLYAGNLLSQPWRKEYRQIKMYCGFYRHQIEANLVNAELMFEVLGYKRCGNGVLVLEGPICPDRVTSVSKDCLIAYVECQIIKAIWEEISPAFKITWLEILDFRKTHLCSPEQSIRALNYQFHEKQYQAQNSDIYTRCHQSNPPLATYGHSHSVPAPAVPPLPYIYGTNSYCPTYAHPVPYQVPLPYPPHLHTMKPNFNGYCCTNGYAPSTYGYTVPTGQLIELDAQQSSNYDVVDNTYRRNSLKRNDENGGKKKEKEQEAHFEDWDYVYRDLESQGYSKDLGERGDVLSLQTKMKTTNLDEAMQGLTVTDRPLKIVEALDKYEEVGEVVTHKRERKRSQGSSYENVSEAKKPTVPKKIEKAKDKVSNSQARQKAELDKWECKACTYHNDNSKNICEMCSKSRSIVDQQMEIGGPQCSECTLVNLKDTKQCQACGASLKNSPTYI